MDRIKQIFSFVFSLVLITLPVLAFSDDKQANVSVEVVRVDDSASFFTLVLLAALFIILLVIVFYLLRYITMQNKKRRALKEKVRIDPDEKKYKDDRKEYTEEVSDLSMNPEVDKYLKEDEKTVISILRQRDGVCSQSTLRIAGNFSKATLSRILKELEERNIIKKEQIGKKNLVILK